jgi:hypothetical protein
MRSAELSASLVVLALLVGALAVGLWSLRSGSSPSHVAETFDRAREVEGLAPAELAPTPLEPARAAIVEPHVGPVAPQPEPVVEVAAVEAGESPVAIPTMEVVIVVVEVDGTELRDVDGTGEALLWTGRSGNSSRFELDSGRFTLPIVEGLNRIEIRECKVDGEPLDCRDASLKLPHDGPLVFVLRRPAGIRLRVVASDTRTDLAEIQVVTGASFEHDELEHPSGRAKTTIVTGGRSPLDLPPRVGRDTDFWVQAPGYAWQRVQLELARGGERLVELELAGAVECTILGAALPVGATLRGWRGAIGGTPDADFDAVRETKLEIEGLTPGEWCFKVQKGRWFQDPLDLAVGTVTVDAGLTQVLVLTVAESAEAPARVAVSGVVRIDESWQGLDRLRLSLQPEGEVKRWDTGRKHVTPVRNGTQFTWNVRQLYAGRYMVVVSPSAHRQLLEVTADGSNEFVIDVPPPADVEVLVVEAETGSPIAVEHVLWHAAVPAGVSGFNFENAHYDVALGARFQAPVGKLSLRVSQDGFAHASEDVEVVRGVNRFTLRIERACGLRIEYFDGETPVPQSAFGMFEVEPIGHEGRKSANSDTWSHVSAPGRYMVTFESPPGFQPVPPQEVTIPAGEMITVRVNLERNP